MKLNHQQHAGLLISLLTALSNAAADPALNTAEPPQSQSADVWQHSQQQAEQLWQQSRSTVSDWWQRAQRKAAPTDMQPPLSDAEHLSHLWNSLLPTLERTLVLQDEQRTRPPQAWLRRDQVDVQADIAALLDEAVAVLSEAPVQQYRARIRELEQAISNARQDIDQYRQQRIGAPLNATLGKTRSEYDALIAKCQATINTNTQELNSIKQQFAQELRQIGLNLTDEQVDFLLTTVVGDNLIDLGIVFDNIKIITEQLEELVRDSGEDLNSTRRYYGLYVVLLRAFTHMHLTVEQVIEADYIPRIDAIAQRARELSQETRALQQTQLTQANVLNANLAAQELTMRATQLYSDYLLQQAEQVRAARLVLERDLATALNTYETVRVSGEFVNLVKTSQQLIDGVLKRQVPALQPFQNLALKREFEKLTVQLRTHHIAAR
ncbi:hypothetical protein HUU62_01025 [Rhodoferax sp. 4810]|uniref:Uncharacterized protein n=1 Tax=Thiospirillum jenense TaxID=1653858 RepID=A0A839HCM8_9GAMM|nr:hypothetical protein [Thiospirillum jenense]MBB1072999.1 hypothetical protein [Rhodoferax jenense]MBB1124947.1 hypothetical protein [Thiospirillum jenense]